MIFVGWRDRWLFPILTYIVGYDNSGVVLDGKASQLKGSAQTIIQTSPA